MVPLRRSSGNATVFINDDRSQANVQRTEEMQVLNQLCAEAELTISPALALNLCQAVCFQSAELS